MALKLTPYFVGTSGKTNYTRNNSSRERDKDKGEQKEHTLLEF